MDAPGKFDISKTEELGITLGLPEDLWDDIDDAASMVHMMNANTFTGAVYLSYHVFLYLLISLFALLPFSFRLSFFSTIHFSF